MNINNDLRFGLAYDVVLNQIQNNSLEFMLGYSFKVDYDKPEKNLKTQDIYKKILHESELNQNEYEENSFKFSSRIKWLGLEMESWRY